MTLQPHTDATDATSMLALSRAEYAQLLAAARASVAAEREGHRDPLVYVRAILTDRGQIPPIGAHVPALLAAIPVALNMPLAAAS